jgi:choline dehydrogenase-like flavoprotein
MATQDKVDVVVVGAGPSGSVFADVLARAGKMVAILEFGPDWDYKQFVSSEFWGKRLKHAPRFQLAGRNNPGHGSNAGWGTGGAMIHFFANFPRLHPSDFKIKRISRSRASTARVSTGRSPTTTSRPTTTASPKTSASPAMRQPSGAGTRSSRIIRCRR